MHKVYVTIKLSFTLRFPRLPYSPKQRVPIAQINRMPPHSLLLKASKPHVLIFKNVSRKGEMKSDLFIKYHIFVTDGIREKDKRNVAAVLKQVGSKSHAVTTYSMWALRMKM